MRIDYKAVTLKRKPQRQVMPISVIKKRKTKAQYAALSRLNSFLNKNNPRIVRFLVRLWNDQDAAITYKELREAILAGAITEEMVRAWQNDYAVFFNRYLRDEILAAITHGGMSAIATTLAETNVYRPMLTAIDNWVSTHGAEWISQMSEAAQEAVSSMVGYTAHGNMTVDELSRVIRPTIGLTKTQSLANLKYYENCKEDIMRTLLDKNPTMSVGAAERQAIKRAKESALRYAARQHRERAMTIAETELAFAYNKGADDAIHQAVDEGLLPPMNAQWSTAADEGVCGICSALDGVKIPLGDTFRFRGRSLYEEQKSTPPAHPRCRCALCYVEAE